MINSLYEGQIVRRKTVMLVLVMLAAVCSSVIAKTLKIYILAGQSNMEGHAKVETFGKLTAGYGARSNPAENGGKIGPEFTFGIAMEKTYDGPSSPVRYLCPAIAPSAELLSR